MSGNKQKKKVFYVNCFYDRLHLGLEMTNGFCGIRF